MEDTFPGPSAFRLPPSGNCQLASISNLLANPLGMKSIFAFLIIEI